VTTTNARGASITTQRLEESAEAVERVPSTPSESAADLRLAADVDRALRSTGYLELREVRISVHHGCVTLQGCVRTYYLKQLAQGTIMSLPDTEIVENLIVVV
jgi:osmotically-inducible protein OsmY